MVTFNNGVLNTVSKGKNLEREHIAHHERIEAIKRRKSNSSCTLDNATPKTLEGRTFVSSRKAFTKKLFCHTTGQQNRYLFHSFSVCLIGEKIISVDFFYQR